MKNLILTIVLLLATSFVFASSNVEKSSTYNVEETVEIFTSSNLLIVEDCKITVKDNETGKSYTVTIHGQSCADFVKELMKKK